MKKMFYKKIKILLLLLISFFVFQQVIFCDETEEAALLANLQNAKDEKQERKRTLNFCNTISITKIMKVPPQ